MEPGIAAKLSCVSDFETSTTLNGSAARDDGEKEGSFWAGFEAARSDEGLTLETSALPFYLMVV